jgi:hypothetical protein
MNLPGEDRKKKKRRFWRMQLHQGCSWGSVWIRRRESASAHQSAPPSCRTSPRIPRRPPEQPPPLRSPAGQPATTSPWPRNSPLQEGGQRGRPQHTLGVRVCETVWSSHTGLPLQHHLLGSSSSSLRPPPLFLLLPFLDSRILWAGSWEERQWECNLLGSSGAFGVWRAIIMAVALPGPPVRLTRGRGRRREGKGDWK